MKETQAFLWKYWKLQNHRVQSESQEEALQ